jgi:hypothetical protein
MRYGNYEQALFSNCATTISVCDLQLSADTTHAPQARQQILFHFPPAER